MKKFLLFFLALIATVGVVAQTPTPQTIGSANIPVLNPGMFEIDNIGRIWSTKDTAQVRAAFPGRPLHGRTATVMGVPYIFIGSNAFGRWINMGNDINLQCLAKLTAIQNALTDAARDPSDPQRKPLYMVTSGGSYYGTVGLQLGGCLGYPDSTMSAANFLPLNFTYDQVVQGNAQSLNFSNINNYILKGITATDSATTRNFVTTTTNLLQNTLNIQSRTGNLTFNLKNLPVYAGLVDTVLYKDPSGKIWAARINASGGTGGGGVDTIWKSSTSTPTTNYRSNGVNYTFYDRNGAEIYTSTNQATIASASGGQWKAMAFWIKGSDGLLTQNKFGILTTNPLTEFDVNGAGRFSNGLTSGARKFSITSGSKQTGDLTLPIPNATDSVAIILHSSTVGANVLVLPPQAGGQMDTVATRAYVRANGGGGGGGSSDLATTVANGNTYLGTIYRPYIDTATVFKIDGPGGRTFKMGVALNNSPYARVDWGTGSTSLRAMLDFDGATAVNYRIVNPYGGKINLSTSSNTTQTYDVNFRNISGTAALLSDVYALNLNYVRQLGNRSYGLLETSDSLDGYPTDKPYFRHLTQDNQVALNIGTDYIGYPGFWFTYNDNGNWLINNTAPIINPQNVTSSYFFVRSSAWDPGNPSAGNTIAGTSNINGFTNYMPNKSGTFALLDDINYLSFKSVSANYTINGSDQIIRVTSTATITFPDATQNSGLSEKRTITIKPVGVTVTLATVSSQTIEGGNSITATTQYISDGTNWIKL